MFRCVAAFFLGHAEYEKHLGSKQEFTNWLTSMYLFYLINRLVDYEDGVQNLPEIHQRIGQDEQDLLDIKIKNNGIKRSKKSMQEHLVNPVILSK